MVAIDLKPGDMASYRLFMQVKRLPRYRIVGRTAYVPDEYADRLGLDAKRTEGAKYSPSSFLFDYQRDISRLAIRKRKFAVFMEPGRGKTLIDYEYAHHALTTTGKRVLIVCPLMVTQQMLDEHDLFYGAAAPPIEQIRAAKLAAWINSDGPAIGITNYEAITDDTPSGNLGALILSESSMLKSMYGKWGLRLIEMGRGLDWKLCETGTPAPNDRIEYGNHAVFLDQFRTTNEFLARYFVNRGQTCERWELRPHALRPFYRDLSHWCIFVSNPAVYGWHDRCDDIPPVHVHIEHVELTGAQRRATQLLTGGLFSRNAGGITQRSKLSRIGKGIHNGEMIATLKPQWVVDQVRRFAAAGESCLVWCKYNDEQDALERLLGADAASIQGATPYDDRIRIIESFKRGEPKILLSKPKVLGFGLNLQVATRHVFSTLQDSYEEFYQAIKRSNRIGSTDPLNVHIPITEIEQPMVETVLSKAHRVQQDTEEQEQLFKECGCGL